MSRVCQVTGARPGFGHAISHSHRRTKRRFNVNVHSKRYWVPSLGRQVTLTVNRDYDISLVGQRFLIGTATSDVKAAATIVLNWASGLKKGAALNFGEKKLPS